MQQLDVEHLQRAGAFPHPVQHLQLLQTHISWVLLSGPFAYKIKKPLDLGFLDFSSLERRRHFCEEEVRLNRRFAPELYLEVVSIRGPASAPRFAAADDDSAGPLLDYAVKMRQFPQSGVLQDVAERGQLDTALLRRLGQQMAHCHRDLPHLPATDAAATPERFAAAAEENFRQLGAYPLPEAQRRQLQTTRRWMRQRFERLRGLMGRRVEQGFIKDCHGDLHLGNIALVDGQLRFFDCIEFNPDLRHMDTMAEIGFTSMDLQARGLSAQAHTLLNDYLEYRGDYAGLALLDLYRCYYALVRAKVILMEEPVDHPQLVATDAFQRADRYLQLAADYGRTKSPFLALMHGVSGSGKSTVAAHLLRQSGAIRLRSDVERKRLFGLEPEDDSAARGLNLYTAKASHDTFAHLRKIADEVLDAGFACLVDATFLERRARRPFLQLARARGVRALILDCCADAATLRVRLQRRSAEGSDASEADVAVMERQLGQCQAFSDSEQPLVRSIDTGQPLERAPLQDLCELS